MRSTRLLWAALTLLPALAVPAHAHHSFAAFFDASKSVTVTGKVIEFRFTNPHGAITLSVPGTDRHESLWKIETNAPVVLVRRGWSRSIIKPGDTITVTGWPARDGKPYIRLREARDRAGKEIGSSPFGQGDT